MLDEEEFKEWLRIKNGYTKKTAADVLSRIKRVNKLISLPEKINDYTIYELNKSKEFNKISVSVKSQLRRAILLLKEYQNIQHK